MYFLVIQCAFAALCYFSIVNTCASAKINGM